jgi:hypothetical protein
MGAAAAGCDQGPYQNASLGVGPPVEVVAQPVLVTVPSTPTSSQPSTQIQIAFDRLLMPDTSIRQTFILQDGSGNSLNPAIAYDPYTRVVTITPPPPILPANQNYRLSIAPPAGPRDPNGLRAIDGATLDPTIPQPFIIQVPMSIPAAAGLPTIDFCNTVQPIFEHCAGSVCHIGQTKPAAGLLLDTAANIEATAWNRIALGSNTGPWFGDNGAPIESTFGIDMPIIDQAKANAANSWLMYKILLAKPNPTDAGVNDYAVAWQAMTADERARLANLVPGREMPYPGDFTQTPEDNEQALADYQYEQLSLWIAEGAQVEQCQ